jgi:hypothetical protein
VAASTGPTRAKDALVTLAERNRAWEAFCGTPIRVILPQSFDTEESAACPKCVELAILWAANP